MVKSPPAGAGDTGLSPGPGGSHVPRSGWARAPQLLSLRSRAYEPQLLKPTCLEPVLRSKGSHRNEKPAHCREEWPHSLQLGRAHMQRRRPNAAKNK